jgi:hypothetical protein
MKSMTATDWVQKAYDAGYLARSQDDTCTYYAVIDRLRDGVDAVARMYVGTQRDAYGFQDFDMIRVNSRGDVTFVDSTGKVANEWRVSARDYVQGQIITVLF